jgi:hypothetical protein
MGRSERVDILTSIFYAAVCGVLAALSPEASSRPIRGLIGMAVGLVAAGAWPILHGLILK